MVLKRLLKGFHITDFRARLINDLSIDKTISTINQLVHLVGKKRQYQFQHLKSQ